MEFDVVRRMQRSRVRGKVLMGAAYVRLDITFCKHWMPRADKTAKNYEVPRSPTQEK
jgi:hypothetical protein